ncbi:MAG TPA: hypothetical protein VMP68_08630 [Candidatus Eisenbacteria bacterium]|nr:hypothetical protein [Candidatus Eisenbacteria bacterium]
MLVGVVGRQHGDPAGAKSPSLLLPSRLLTNAAVIPQRVLAQEQTTVSLVATPTGDTLSLSRGGLGKASVEHRPARNAHRAFGTSSLGGRAIRILLPLLAIVLVILTSPSLSLSADVVFIRSAEGSTTAQGKVELAAQFYGLNLKVLAAAPNQANGFAISSAVSQRTTVAVAIAADALPQVNRNQLLRALRRQSIGSVPLLIIGLTPASDPGLLKTWSGGAVLGCKRLAGQSQLRYAFAHVQDLTGQLGGIEIPLTAKYSPYFALARESDAKTIVQVTNDAQVVCVFIEATLQGEQVFLDCTGSEPSNGVPQAQAASVVDAFQEIFSALIFMRYCAGVRGWHTPHQYANLTIDDPTLREPYGFLNYRGLLGEMERHNFYTTIAFIPWNYDRNSAAVVSLVRDHPEKFSICIHGDNHDHKEFADYRSKPLDVQVADLRQALDRMDAFETLTGIPYAKVMVFPHSIAPEETLEALKSFGYLATINSSNVPMGASEPSSLLFNLRPITLLFGDFPSITRYSAAVPVSDAFIAISAFLGNPILLYCHHELFEKGIGAFDGVADQVNRLAPDTRWRGVGDIVRHFYLVRRADNGTFDVLAFSRSVALENASGQASLFRIRKREFNHPMVASVRVDGQSCPFSIHNGYLEFSVSIAPGTTRDIAIEYAGKATASGVAIKQSSVRVYLLRMASEFRDNTLYRSAPGRAIIHVYYDSDGEPRPFGALVLAVVTALICLGAAWGLRAFLKKRGLGRRSESSVENPQLVEEATSVGRK